MGISMRKPRNLGLASETPNPSVNPDSWHQHGGIRRDTLLIPHEKLESALKGSNQMTTIVIKQASMTDG